jgi:two-component system cell cycle sensor histidine kinase/response regulator CckA
MKKKDHAQTEELVTLLRKSIDVASDAVFWLDDAGRFVYVNDAACRSVGYSSQELLQMTLFDINPESSKEAWGELLKTIRTAGTVRIESVHKRKDGSIFPVEIMSILVTLRGREFVNGFARDITERKRMESMLHQQIAELSALQSTLLDITVLHQLPAMLQIIVERTADLLHAEGAALYLCDPEKAEVRCVVGFRTPRDYVGTVLKYGEGASGAVAQTGQPLLIEDYRTWPGRSRIFESERPFKSVIAMPMLWQGKVTGVIDAIRFRDSTPFSPDDLRLLGLFANHAAIARENARLREGLERELAEHKRSEEARIDLERRMLSAQKLEGLGLLAGGVAHDFNNMLAVILGHAELLRMELAPDSGAGVHVNEIITATERSGTLTRQLLAVGQRQSLEMKPLDLNAVIRGLDGMLRRTVRESITLAVRTTPVGPVLADEGQIDQVILNLVANAQDAMPKGGMLTVETGEVELDEASAKDHVDVKPGRYVLLSVADTGEGMTAETVRRIFDPFFTTKGTGKGTGLGLPTVYGIVKQHGGSIEVQSAPGQGSRFKVFLPRTTASLEETRSSEPAQQLQGEETVLVVEDQDQIRGLVGILLRGCGYTVLDARDGASAIRVARQHEGTIHLLVTDVVLAGMNGRDLYAALVLERKGLKVLYMSGYPGDILDVQGIPAAGVDLIQKPFTLNALAVKVREVLTRA